MLSRLDPNLGRIVSEVGGAVVEDRKQIVSMRLGAAELRKVKALARRLRVRESDIYRLAVRSLTRRLASLCDETLAGAELMPVLLTGLGRELIQQFELDARRLDGIVNAGVSDPATEVPWDDLELLALLALPESHAVGRFRRLTGQTPQPGGLTAYVDSQLRERYLAWRPPPRDRVTQRVTPDQGPERAPIPEAPGVTRAEPW
jgi:hypothetical protein